MRASGEKYHDVELSLSSGGVEQSLVAVYRFPGDPDEQSATASDILLDLTKRYTAVVKYTPENDPVNGQPNGATPVKLIISFEDGTTEELTNNFNYNHPDEWTWSVDVNAHMANHEVTYDAFVYDPGSDDVQLALEFNDGASASMTFDSAGNMPTLAIGQVKAAAGAGMTEMTIHATDDDGGSYQYVFPLSDCSDGLGSNAMMITNLAPNVDIGAHLAGDKDSDIAFACSVTDESNIGSLDFSWNFGDGSSADGQAATHAYSFAGNYFATVKVTDEQGAIGVAFVGVTVTNTDPIASIGLDGPTIYATADNLISLMGSGTDTFSDEGNLVYYWDFGDGNSGFGAAQLHSYSSPGTYNLALTVADNQHGVDTDSVTVVVSNVVPSLDCDDVQIYGKKQQVTLSCAAADSYSDIFHIAYSWDLGDGSTATTAAVSHEYSLPGIYAVTLTITDPHGGLAAATISASVAIDDDVDGLTNDFETSTSHTNPQKADSDDDFLLDYDEYNVYGTDPMEDDYDADGLQDWYEVMYIGYDSSTDVDGDGALPSYDPDSDNDGIPDNFDTMPLRFDSRDGVVYDYDAVTIDNNLNIIVAIDYKDDSIHVPPQVTSYAPSADIDGHVGNYIDLVNPSYDYWSICVKIKYSSVPAGVTEANLRMYFYPAGGIKWLFVDDSGVDTNSDFIWGDLFRHRRPGRRGWHRRR